MAKDMTVSERVASRYAEIFVSVFDRIIANPDDAVLCNNGSFPQQGADGVPFNGSNAMLTSLVSAERGYGMPIWITRSRRDELGLLTKPGERSVPVVHYDIYYEDLRTGKRDASMTDAVYATLTDEDRKNFVKRCYMSCYPEFNLEQTNFAEVYPEQWEELKRTFEVTENIRMDCPVLDAVVGTSDRWLCPVIEDQAASRFSYNEGRDEIHVPQKAVFADESRWYGDLLYTMSRSTGSEGRLDRDINSPELTRAAREELVSELAGATLSTLAGVQSTLQDHNLANLKSWVSVISENPEVIYRAVNDASKAADMVSKHLGMEQKQGFNLQKLMDGAEAAQKAKEAAMERREKRSREASRGHRKGWRPLKAGKPSKGRKI